ncbi:hypothetical protein Syn7502_00123 [Synechococcus sp. PCC 7502]|uniref:hypothetical protein n=1 Tax=Synechococcus sp. PCC 7502 TaxID=1173263 RepID=UPI00029FCF06|nr:hypothetical protein [Synechococcus sp. PCC 7502]AFY72295.1 hypothetical protein Syn7502_00123 [Synechococcus sp. PCC 7502]
MNQLKKLLQRDQSETEITKQAIFSDWLLFVEIDLEGESLQFSESRVLGLRGNDEYECFEIPVDNGKYAIASRVVNHGADARVAAMRAYPSETDTSKLLVVGTVIQVLW